MEIEAKQTRQIPLVAIRGSVVFPYTDVVLNFGRKKSIDAVVSAFQEDRVVGIFTQKDARTPDPAKEDLHKIGTIAVVSQMMQTDGEVHAVVRGQKRITLDEIVSFDPYLIGKVHEVDDDPIANAEEKNEIEALSNKLSELFKKSINIGKTAEIMTVMKLVSGKVEPTELADQVASLLELTTRKKQELLEILSLRRRLEKTLEYLMHETNILELERSISDKTQKRFEDQMRKAMLREKKRTIEEELGEEMGEGGAAPAEEIQTYKKKIKEAAMPKEVELKATRELKRLSQLSQHNPETGYLRNYLDWLVDMPWRSVTEGNVSVSKAGKVLDSDHYGIDKAKERILEYLSVMKVKEDNPKKNDSGKKKKRAAENEDVHITESQPTILCFVGPPGVGKTSIGKSIAKALARKFVRISLGGIRDEAEIRGHRRTYVGALPGRIIQGIKNAGSKNPVFMLDEIDKLGQDFRGDPSSALLEALDPEQNVEFSDHYLEVPFDLSQVMFIATANTLENIPGPLRDRMEVIKFAGYTQDEKFHIAKNFLWPKQLRMHGLDDFDIKIADVALNQIINRYTREAGVRDLERNLAKVCRKLAKLIAEKEKYPRVLSVSHIKKFLGPEKFTSLIAEQKDEVGMSTGLAVTGAGGEILFIEVALMPGKGRLTLTGQLGDVMKESAQAAFTWAKSHWFELGLKEDFGAKLDVHIHVPEGAQPKDGPSAGIAITTALVSALTGIAVHREVGMTGEVTLRGRVMEIGGVKEKVIAAHRAGLKTIILPQENKKDMEDVPDPVKKDIEFVFAERLDQVLPIALTRWPVVTVKSPSERSSRPSFLAVN
jgi:ATP-dependent Lon protease